MKAGEVLRSHHLALAERFSNLARARAERPVFAIEHDLTGPQLEELTSALSIELEQDPQLKDVNWTWCYLPLLIVATEAGYRYMGTGTDFWPLLSRQLGTVPGGQFRSAITRLFEIGHRDIQLARPGKSPWELNFPLIAWPIGNALVPLEIQPQITDALRRAIRAGVSVEDDDSLLEYLSKLASGHASRRFEHWLQNGEVALEVMRRLLISDAEGWISAGILTRIDEDIRKDTGSFDAISEARRGPTRRALRAREFPSSRFIVGLSGGSPDELAIRGPVLNADLREEVVAGLRIHGNRISAKGAYRSVSLHSFLAGGEIAIGPLRAQPEAPLHRGSAAWGPQVEAANKLLEKLQPSEATFFLVESGERTAAAVYSGDALPSSASIIEWVRNDNAASLDFRRLEADVDSDADYLRRHGFRLLSKQPALRVLGLPMPGTTPKFAAGFPILAIARSSGVTPVLDGGQRPVAWTSLGGERWAVFQPPPGDHLLSAPDLDDADTILLGVVEPPSVEPAYISIHPANATLRDLELGKIEIRVFSPIALEQMSLCLRISSAGQLVAEIHANIDRLPHIIAGGSPLLRTLQSKLLEHDEPLSAVRLHVEVCGIRPAHLLLSPAHIQLHYDSSTGLWSDERDTARTYSTLIATPDSPIPHAESSNHCDLRLLLPDSGTYQALRSGIILANGGRYRLAQISAEKVNLPRLIRAAASRDGIAGLTDIAKSIVAWKMAKAPDHFSNWRRFSIVEQLEESVVELLCGAAWRKIEDQIDLTILSPHGALFRCAQSIGLLTGEDLPQIKTHSDWMFFKNCLIDRFRPIVPTIAEARRDWCEDLGGELDLAVIEAYEDLRSDLEKNGQQAFEEVDMARPAEDWLKALEQAQDMPLIPMFRKFILPDSRWVSLADASYDELSQDDLVDILDDCHVDASRRPGQRWIGRAELRTLVQFWLSPDAMIDEEDWPRLLSKTLSDVRTARAVRYGALRYKLARMDLRDGMTL